MKEKRVYICEKCGSQYDSGLDAEECESTHIMPVSVDCKNVHFCRPSDGPEFRYPLRIRINMEDGRKVTYYYERTNSQ